MKDRPTDNGKPSSEQSRSDDWSIFDRVVPEGIKKGIEHLIREGRLKNVLSEIKMPKEIITHIMAQVDDTKKAAVQVISREVRLFLENTNLADELAKLLTQISFQVKTEIRFVPNEKAIPKKRAGSTQKIEDESEPENKTEKAGQSTESE